MNGRTARQLRHEAERQTAGQPVREYEVTHQSHPRQHYDPVLDITRTVTPPGTFALKADCTRGRYRRLKRQVGAR